jgi:hypothetical protein
VTVVAFNPALLTEADVRAVRPRILRLIQTGIADRWNLDMGDCGYTAITILDHRDDVVFAISKQRGAYRVVNDGNHPVVESRRLENVLAVLS